MIDFLPSLLEEAEFVANQSGNLVGGYSISKIQSSKKASHKAIHSSSIPINYKIKGGGRFEGFAVPIGLYMEPSSSLFTGGSVDNKSLGGKVVNKGYMDEEQFGLLFKTVSIVKPKRKHTPKRKPNAAKKTKKART
jgi:hypothetical protein